MLLNNSSTSLKVIGMAVIKAVSRNTNASVMSDGLTNLFSIIAIAASEIIVAMMQTKILDPCGNGTNTARNS